ncbi:MAG: IclR family transcriptional regulator [Peptoniphilaceae bacterium]|nr:IclR family transcriptional regulator [Peptoniphilaceae bacterium]MDY6018500.1 IclR family transcriptional regulator [Anaerococcus sp.]
MNNKDQPIKAIVNACKILDLISENTLMGISEISRELELPKTTVFRIIKTLEASDLLIQTKDDLYALSYKFLKFKYGVDEDTNLIKHSKDALAKMADCFGETVNLAVHRAEKSIVIYSQEGEDYTLNPKVSPVSELYCSATGKIFLTQMYDNKIKAYYDQAHTKRTINTIVSYKEFLKERNKILKTKISYDDEEYEYGLSCIATPIIVKGNLLAALGISGPTTRLKHKGYKKLEKGLLETAKVIEESIASVR